MLNIENCSSHVSGDQTTGSLLSKGCHHNTQFYEESKSKIYRTYRHVAVEVIFRQLYIVLQEWTDINMTRTTTTTTTKKTNNNNNNNNNFNFHICHTFFTSLHHYRWESSAGKKLQIRRSFCVQRSVASCRAKRPKMPGFILHGWVWPPPQAGHLTS